MTAQPKWIKVANLGDVNPLDYGGHFVYRDRTGIYAPESELLEVNDDGSFTVRRWCLDRCKIVTHEDTNYMVPFAYTESWPYAVHQYVNWFDKDLARVADCEGVDVATLRTWLCSDDPILLAGAYHAIGAYHGFDNLDAYPQTLTRAQSRKRFRRWL